jgi:hypothetical protein
MVNLEHLRMRGLRAYELGRLRSASRIAFLLVPLTALCLYEQRGRQACACIAVVLLGLAIWLRWRDRLGSENVTTGLIAGGLPLISGIALDRAGLECSLAGGSVFCNAFAVLVGAAGGALIGLREHTRRARLFNWLTAGSIAVLAASLGCIRLGVVGVASVVAGLALGSIAMAALRGRAPGP